MKTSGSERWVWVGLGVVVAAVATAGLFSLRRRASPGATLPVLKTLPAFALTERAGTPLTLADLAGRPWVADFIFTRCTGICPALSTRMRELRQKLDERGLSARVVSFSVDPTHDTPAVLREYAQHFGADADWLFATGNRDALYRLIGQGFQLSVAERSPDEAKDGGELITHSDRFVLVDGQGRIRAYYHGSDASAVPDILRDVAALQSER
jgi:protein SCO1